MFSVFYRCELSNGYVSFGNTTLNLIKGRHFNYLNKWKGDNKRNRDNSYQLHRPRESLNKLEAIYSGRKNLKELWHSRTRVQVLPFRLCSNTFRKAYKFITIKILKKNMFNTYFRGKLVYLSIYLKHIIIAFITLIKAIIIVYLVGSSHLDFERTNFQSGNINNLIFFFYFLCNNNNKTIMSQICLQISIN